MYMHWPTCYSPEFHKDSSITTGRKNIYDKIGHVLSLYLEFIPHLIIPAIHLLRGYHHHQLRNSHSKWSSLARSNVAIQIQCCRASSGWSTRINLKQASCLMSGRPQRDKIALYSAPMDFIIPILVPMQGSSERVKCCRFSNRIVSIAVGLHGVSLSALKAQNNCSAMSVLTNRCKVISDCHCATRIGKTSLHGRGEWMRKMSSAHPDHCNRLWIRTISSESNRGMNAILGMSCVISSSLCNPDIEIESTLMGTTGKTYLCVQ